MSFSSVRRFATAAAAKSPLVINKNRILASVILSRSPQITRDATPFERAYFDYKEKLERQQASRFPTEFYFKKGSLAERRWKEEEAARQAAMNDPNQSLTEAVLETQASFQDETSARSNLVQASRVTDADKNNDLKSLDRALQRTLYLVVRQSEGGDRWIFPQGQLESSEYLHEAAERYLQHHCGSDMDVWFVGRQPVSFYREAPSRKNDTEGQKVFFMKARIFAGQVKPSNGVNDFAWLTKEELEKYLSPEYYNAIKDSLGDL